MESVIRIAHEDQQGGISWKACFPDNWKDPYNRRIIMFSGKPDRDVRPKVRLLFRDPNKPIFASNWQQNAYVQAYDPKGTLKKNYQKVFLSMGGDEKIPLPEYPGLIGCFACIPIAKSASKKNRAEQMGQPATVMPDFDNLVKFYLDLMQDIIIPSDEKVSTGIVDKFMGQHPGVMFVYYPRVDSKAITEVFKLRKLFKSYACPDLFNAAERTGELFTEA